MDPHFAAASAALQARSASPTASDASYIEQQSLESLVELNNEGASLLENSLHSEAISTLTTALALAVKENIIVVDPEQLQELSTSPTASIDGLGTLSERTDSSETPVNVSATAKSKKVKRRKPHRRNSINSMGSKEASTSRPPSRRERRRKLVRRVRSAMGLGSRKDDTETTTEDVFQPPQKYVHLKPLRVRDRYNIPGKVELAIYIVQNLALAYHLQARACMSGLDISQRDAGPNWERVIRLYQLTSDLFEQEQQRLDEEEALTDPTSLLYSPTYTVALPNNMACAYHASGDDAKASIAWQQALSHLWCMLDVGCISEVDCFAEILENASHLIDSGSKIQPAPAA